MMHMILKHKDHFHGSDLEKIEKMFTHHKAAARSRISPN